MVLYICPRCNYTTHQVSDIKRHFGRKTPCIITHRFISIEECLYELYNRKTKKTLRNPDKTLKNAKKTLKSRVKTPKKREKRTPPNKKTPNILKEGMGQTNNVILENAPAIKQFCCMHCGADFTRKDNLKVHIENYCKNIFERPNNDTDKLDNLKKQLDFAKKIREDDQKHINNLTKQVGYLIGKVGNTYNNTFNIVINPFGKENTSYITDEYIKKLIESGPYFSIPRLLKHIHFNPEHKENNNIKITNRKQPYVQIYNGEKWLLKNKKEAIENISDTAYSLLNEHYEGGDKYMNKFNSEYSSDGDITKKIQKKVELVILNSTKDDGD